MPSVSKNIVWLSVSRLLAMAMLFFAYTQLFRYLGPFGTGQHQFVLSLVAIFGVVADLGISQYVTKKIAENHLLAKKYFHNFLAAELVLAVFIFGAMVLLSSVRNFEPVVFHAVLVAGVGLMLYGLTIPFLTVLSAFQDMKRVAVINFIASLVNAVIIFSAIIFHRYIVFLATQQIIAGIIALTLYYRYIKNHISQPEVFIFFRSVDWHFLKKILIAAVPFAMLVSFSTIYNRVDVLLITKYLGYEDTGLYTAAYKFVDLMNFFPAVVSHSLYPAFVSLMSKGSIGEVRLMLEKYLRLLVFFALPIGVGGSLLAKELVVLVAGKEFEASAGVLALLAPAIAILFIYIVANSLVISQLTRFAVIITGVNVLVNILGNIILLPKIGIKGAAIMTIVSESLQAMFYFYFIRSRITTFKVDSLWKPVFASVVMGFAVYMLKSVNFTGFLSTQIPYLILLVSFGGAVYLITLFAMQFFTKEDLLLIRKLFRL